MSATSARRILEDNIIQKYRILFYFILWRYTQYQSRISLWIFMLCIIIIIENNILSYHSYYIIWKSKKYNYCDIYLFKNKILLIMNTLCIFCKLEKSEQITEFLIKYVFYYNNYYYCKLVFSFFNNLLFLFLFLYITNNLYLKYIHWNFKIIYSCRIIIFLFFYLELI